MEHFRHTAHIGTHTLSYALRGIPRQPGAPLVVVFTGITSSALEWSAVCRDLEQEATLLLYERSGYGQSEATVAEPDSLTIVEELSRLLVTAALPPPYLVERMLFETWPDPSIAAVTAGLDYMEVVGLSHDHQLTDAEWAELMAEEASSHHARQAVRELPYLQISRPVLARKQQLHPATPDGGRALLHGQPLSVLRGISYRDQQRLYNRGVAQGLGTEAHRATFRNYLAKVAITFTSWSRSELQMKFAGF
ncbi:catalytic protein [Penicillium canescens]|uniref:Catalytic protein n=1 Tax=Penicillium canescens TaxID=5083 RepID=A0AAD6N843_PENCN|nr:catalytic protein [Penicillium canescens]